jgi:hypothetical protein
MKHFTLSKEAREKIAVAQRARWAKIRGEKESSMSKGKSDGPSAVPGPIKEMFGGGQSDADFKDSLPTQTSAPDEFRLEPPPDKPKRKYSKKDKGSGAEVTDDPRLERAKAKCSGLGGAALIESGFMAAQKPLDDKEQEDLEDQFYLISIKAGLDPMGSWVFLIVYTVVLLSRLVLVRTELGEEVREWMREAFERKEKPEGQQAVN